MTDSNDTHTAELPTPAAGPALRILDVSSIEPSLSNPRKHFNQMKLQELADSIKASGVHQPVLVRPLPGSRVAETFGFRRQGVPLPVYELVAGERRLRACRLAGVTEIPAMIRELTDDQVLEIQIVENLQRDDLTELEEAEGYEHLMQHSGMNADQVGAKIGKSRSYVYARLKLTALCYAARTALREGTLDASKALLIARIPDEKLQVKALDYVTKPYYADEPISYRKAADYIQREFMLRLDTAGFDITDMTLAPEAGSCKTCPKRTGHDPDLFSDVKGADVCTYPPCFHKKQDAHSVNLVNHAKAKGQTVIAGKEAQELMTQGYNDKFKGYRRLDVAEDSPTDQPLRKIIGKQMEAEGISPVMIEHPKKKGELVATLTNETALRLLKTVEGQALAAKTVAKEVREFANEKKAKADSKATAQFEQDWRNQLMARAWQSLSTGEHAAFTLDVHRYLALKTANSLSTDQAAAMCRLLDLGKIAPQSGLVDFLKTSPNPDLLQLLMTMLRDCSANDYAYNGRIVNEGLHLVAGIVFKDSLPGVIEEIKTVLREKHFPEKAKKASSPNEQAARPQEGAGGMAEVAMAKGGKKTTRPAASAPVRKSTAAETMEGIAAAMQGIEEVVTPGAAVASQVNAGPGLEPLRSGMRVRINDTVLSPQLAKWVDKEGVIDGPLGDRAWMIKFFGKGKKPCEFHSFDATEIEVVA